jgi:hypothetical protein
LRGGDIFRAPGEQVEVLDRTRREPVRGERCAAGRQYRPPEETVKNSRATSI